SYRGERIPLLEDVLDLLDDKVYYDIELKQLRGRYGPLEEKIAQLITRRGLQDRVMVSSFDPLSIRRLRHFDHGLHTAHIYSDYEEVPRFLRNGAGRFLCNPQVLKPNRFKINRNTLFFKQRLEGYPLITWTEDEREKVDELLKMGVDGVITNVPEQLVSLFQLYWN
ncbi:MAG TPA: glycerophosphodiester phosphodiesterase, partial [Sediminispirochaeta sp.]|nr:glycerophosphodiester phosphodiesterase [Sediminispirochaeta sp.]